MNLTHPLKLQMRLFSKYSIRQVYCSCFCLSAKQKDPLIKTYQSLQSRFTHNKLSLNIGKPLLRFYSDSQFGDYEVSCQQLKKELERGDDVYVIDVREPMELEMFGKISNAKNIPLNQLETALNMSDESFEKKYGFEKPPEDGDDVIFYCQVGVRSLHAMVVSRDHGYERSKHLAGGFIAWNELENAD